MKFGPLSSSNKIKFDIICKITLFFGIFDQNGWNTNIWNDRYLLIKNDFVWSKTTNYNWITETYTTNLWHDFGRETLMK